MLCETAILFYWLQVLTFFGKSHAFIKDEQDLFKYIFQGYDPSLRPVLTTRETLTVKFGLSLHQIMRLDEKSQTLVTSIWIRQQWKDAFLQWNTSEFGGLESIHVHPSKVWKPDLVVYNNVGSSTSGRLDTQHTSIIANNDGRIVWLSPVIIKTSCKIHIEYYPFDEQFCEVKIGSWTHDGYKVDLQLEAPQGDISKYVTSTEWEMIGVPAVRNEFTYACCPEPYPDITYTVNIRRRTVYKKLNMVGPCLFLSGVVLLSFILPGGCGERIGIVVSTFLAITFFLLYIAQIVPSTSDHVPLLSVYTMQTISWIAAALVATCVSLSLYFHSSVNKTMPPWLVHLAFNLLPKILPFLGAELHQRIQKYQQQRMTLPPEEPQSRTNTGSTRRLTSGSRNKEHRNSSTHPEQQRTSIEHMTSQDLGTPCIKTDKHETETSYSDIVVGQEATNVHGNADSDVKDAVRGRFTFEDVESPMLSSRSEHNINSVTSYDDVSSHMAASRSTGHVINSSDDLTKEMKNERKTFPAI